ncbi:DUF4256 domain-containing protein [Candidatus Peregrinibacteria bacterium]|nr:DUF4256 domain-containing protein [Candidatus Peregrinibacteria bacterium]
MAVEKPTGSEALAILQAAQEAGHLPEGFIEQQLAAMRGETGEQALAAAHVDGAPGKKELSPEESAKLLAILKGRFERNKSLHPTVRWSAVEKSLKAATPEVLFGLYKMEETGGEPDVFMDERNAFVFGDCSAESPSGRRNVVFDKEVEQYASGFNGNAVDMAETMGVELMDEAQYRALQELLPVDAKTWIWLKTPKNVRKVGDALYGFRHVSSVGVLQRAVDNHGGYGAFRAALRVKKVT